MNEELEYFNDMVVSNQLRAINCIKSRAVYNIKAKKIVFVNKLIYWGDDLMIIGYSSESNFKVEDYGKTWREVREDEI